MVYKRRWHANAMDAEAIPDELEDGRQVVQLLVRLSMHGGTPVSEAGREIAVWISRPMLEVLARLAEDVGAVDYVCMPPVFEHETWDSRCAD